MVDRPHECDQIERKKASPAAQRSGPRRLMEEFLGSGLTRAPRYIPPKEYRCGVLTRLPVMTVADIAELASAKWIAG